MREEIDAWLDDDEGLAPASGPDILNPNESKELAPNQPVIEDFQAEFSKVIKENGALKFVNKELAKDIKEKEKSLDKACAEIEGLKKQVAGLKKELKSPQKSLL